MVNAGLVVGWRDSEFEPLARPVLAQGEPVAPRRLVVRAALAQGQEHRPEVFASATGSESRTFTKRVKDSLGPDARPVETDGIEGPINTLDLSSTPVAMHVQAHSVLAVVLLAPLPVARLEVGAGALVQRYRSRRGAT